MNTQTRFSVSIIGLCALLTSCGTTTIVREVQVTQQTTSTTEVQNTIMTASEAITWARNSAPGFDAWTDSSIYSTMSKVCDSIDTFHSDYDGFISQFIKGIVDQKTEARNALITLLVAATKSICTQHAAEIQSALARFAQKS